MRLNNRKNNSLRPIVIEKNFLSNAFSSCLIKAGNTQVICSATLDDFLPHFIKGTCSGWLSAEYSMLPASSATQRIKREVNQMRSSGRTQEIQRLIGRSLRSCLDLRALGERQILIDCDVISADGSTRCAAITGGYVAMKLAIQKLLAQGTIKTDPIKFQVAAVSCGIFEGEIIIDLDYQEDSKAQVDGNFIIDSNMNIIEIQACAEGKSFSQEQLFSMLGAVKDAASEIFKIQNV
jgi:ribonuclease PH